MVLIVIEPRLRKVEDSITKIQQDACRQAEETAAALRVIDRRLTVVETYIRSESSKKALFKSEDPLAATSSGTRTISNSSASAPPSPLGMPSTSNISRKGLGVGVVSRPVAGSSRSSTELTLPTPSTAESAAGTSLRLEQGQGQRGIGPITPRPPAIQTDITAKALGNGGLNLMSQAPPSDGGVKLMSLPLPSRPSAIRPPSMGLEPIAEGKSSPGDFTNSPPVGPGLDSGSASSMDGGNNQEEGGGLDLGLIEEDSEVDQAGQGEGQVDEADQDGEGQVSASPSSPKTVRFEEENPSPPQMAPLPLPLSLSLAPKTTLPGVVAPLQPLQQPPPPPVDRQVTGSGSTAGRRFSFDPSPSLSLAIPDGDVSGEYGNRTRTVGENSVAGVSARVGGRSPHGFSFPTTVRPAAPNGLTLVVPKNSAAPFAALTAYHAPKCAPKYAPPAPKTTTVRGKTNQQQAQTEGDGAKLRGSEGANDQRCLSPFSNLTNRRPGRPSDGLSPLSKRRDTNQINQARPVSSRTKFGSPVLQMREHRYVKPRPAAWEKDLRGEGEPNGWVDKAREEMDRLNSEMREVLWRLMSLGIHLKDTLKLITAQAQQTGSARDLLLAKSALEAIERGEPGIREHWTTLTGKDPTTQMNAMPLAKLVGKGTSRWAITGQAQMSSSEHTITLTRYAIKKGLLDEAWVIAKGLSMHKELKIIRHSLLERLGKIKGVSRTPPSITDSVPQVPDLNLQLSPAQPNDLHHDVQDQAEQNGGE
ncbi:unnamed protein product [Vitrella brassicaformis CCMP3155]|uniref:Uncharacterized protein n=1 Tax=Vitrella brassicaformis (strain CCMP3155) TaxID=1169540 RepID=A0A0G4EJW0_VITBC|nr:unnamed protein product [Vitrella brassicaformis CCMP3155]|eukprot:CEL96827.1 unnamed protein product [Vitrella brassicaformis CCMP3155]